MPETQAKKLRLFFYCRNFGGDFTAVGKEIVKRRWDIEVFFKFIKQLLNFKHFISRSKNGIKVILYVTTMIASILLAAYKKLNHLNGYKIAKKLKFSNELENEIIKKIIRLCGGNPEKLNEILLCNSS